MLKLIDFYADWCAPCRMMDPIFEEVMPDYKDKVELERINVDENPQKAQEFGVMSIPTMVLLKDDKEIDRRIGLLQGPMLKQWLDSHVSD